MKYFIPGSVRLGFSMSIIYGGRKRKKIKHNILYTGMGMVMNLVFTGITIFYVLGQYFARKDLPDETLLAKAAKNGMIVTAVYVLVSLTAVTIAGSYAMTQEQCASPGTLALRYVLLPTSFIMITLWGMLKLCPGWKNPFAYTFGFLAAKIAGVSSALVGKETGIFAINAITAKLQNLLDEVKSNRDILINSMNPTNFYSKINELERDGLLRGGYKKQSGYKKLYALLVLKDVIADAVWFLGAGFYAISVSEAGMAQAKCSKSLATIKKNEADWHADAAAKEAAKKPIQLFSLH